MKVFIAVVFVALLAVPLMHGQQRPAPAPAYPPHMEPKTADAAAPWDYLVAHAVGDNALQPLLNERGRQGWEAFSIRETARSGVEVVFKRPAGRK